MTQTKPLIGITCCSAVNGIHPQQIVGDKYIKAVVDGSQVNPILIPSFGSDLTSLLPHLDGLYLTGSYSNMEPHHFGGEELGIEMPRDPNRDHTNLSLIKQAVAMGLPVLGICRGFQEMNVALGGTLHQQVFELDNMLEHRESKHATIEQQYALSHDIHLNDKGLLATLLAGELTQQVNSLHGQGIDKLAPTLQVEAVAPDGLVEAFSLGDNNSYFLGVQWHPEWRFQQHLINQKIFESFGDACRTYQKGKLNKPNAYLVP